MKLKRILSAGLVAAMLVSGLAACGGTDNSAGGTSGTEASSKNGDIVTLKWVMIGNEMPKKYDSWVKKVNDYVGPKLGVNIDMEVIAWGDWESRRNVVISTNEPYDIIFGDRTNYSNDIQLGAYYDITELIQSEAPELYEYIPSDYWKAMEVDGKIYGVPSYKDSALTNYMIWDKELVDEYELDINSLTTLESLTPSFEKFKADKNDNPVYIKNDGIYQIFDVYDQLGAGLAAMGVRYDDEKAKVCFTLEQDDIMSELKTLHDWNQKGIINSDAATITEGRVYNMWRIAQGWPSAGKTAWGPQMGKPVEVVQWGDSILSNDTVRGAINSISINSKNPEKSLQFLNAVNMDTKLRDMFFYGEEGVNFEYNEDGKVHKINNEWELAGYTQGTFFTVTQEDVDEYGQWEEVKKLNEEAIPSVLLGFTFDKTEVEDQLANCMEIWLRYRSEVMTGVRDPETVIPEIKQEMMDAGLQDLLDVAQTQVDEFMANN